MDGFFIIDKPKAITSQGVCSKIKKKFNTPHVGHSGTLDPDTTGVLVVAVGKATKMLKLINEHDKAYEATIVFGYNSNTLDISGNITEDISIIPIGGVELSSKKVIKKSIISFLT